MSLVKHADVVVENYRPNVKEKLGIDYESLKKVNPRIVLASVSGFGQDGPYKGRPGLDQIAQGIGGLMSVTGEPGRGPMRAGIPVADLTSGLFCAIGTLIALLEREESGEGQWVHTSLLQAQVWMMDFQAMRWLMNGEIPGQSGNDHPTSAPTGVFKTADGFMNIAAMGNDMFERLCKVIGADPLLADERFKSVPLRGKNRPALNEALNEKTQAQTTAYWIDQMNKAGVPCGPILNMQETMEDPQVQHLGMAQSLEHPKLGEVKLVGQAVKFSRSPLRQFTAAPERGEHNAEIFADLGFSEAQLSELKQEGVI